MWGVVEAVVEVIVGAVVFGFGKAHTRIRWLERAVEFGMAHVRVYWLEWGPLLRRAREGILFHHGESSRHTEIFAFRDILARHRTVEEILWLQLLEARSHRWSRFGIPLYYNSIRDKDTEVTLADVQGFVGGGRRTREGSNAPDAISSLKIPFSRNFWHVCSSDLRSLLLLLVVVERSQIRLW